MEYRAYTPGDDLRHVDWNLFARLRERCYLKRERGWRRTVPTDAAAGCQRNFDEVQRRTRVNKTDYARYLAASLMYSLSLHQSAMSPGGADRV